MKIVEIESLHADAGGRNFDFLKVTTDTGLVGWSHLATMMNAHFSAVVPNLRIMEIDPDTVPWQDDLVTVKPEVRNGHLTLPTGPGWGTEVNEAAVRAHPPRVQAPARDRGFRSTLPVGPVYLDAGQPDDGARGVGPAHCPLRDRAGRGGRAL